VICVHCFRSGTDLY